VAYVQIGTNDFLSDFILYPTSFLLWYN